MPARQPSTSSGRYWIRGTFQGGSGGQTCYDRHRRWSADGTWEKVFRAAQADADADGRIDWSMVSVDSTVCRAHQHAVGARKQAPWKPGKRTRPAQHRPDEALGRSRGGLTGKIRTVAYATASAPARFSTCVWRTVPPLYRPAAAVTVSGLYE